MWGLPHRPVGPETHWLVTWRGGLVPLLTGTLPSLRIDAHYMDRSMLGGVRRGDIHVGSMRIGDCQFVALTEGLA